jgi:GTP cyclohydrolase II
MSQAFVRESDEQWLHDVQPTLNALIVYLTRENNGIRVYEKKNFVHADTGKEVYEMSNGLSYTRDSSGKWMVV